MPETTDAPHARPTSTPAAPRLLAVLLAVAMGCGLLSSCSGERPSIQAKAIGDTTSTTTAATSAPTIPLTDRPLGPDNLLGFIATPVGDPEVHSEADPASPAIDVPATTAVGAPTTFAVVGDPDVSASTNGGWIKVVLPTRPNGGTGWVPSSSVEVTRTPLRLFIDLTGRKLRVERDGQPVMETTVAVGTTENPTPVGATYVTELIENVEPDGAYGPYAYGLALHSETLTEFAGGPGQVGVHGTNQPQLIGQPVSHGCVRLTNDDVRKLVDLQLPLGVPVFIT